MNRSGSVADGLPGGPGASWEHDDGGLPAETSGDVASPVMTLRLTCPDCGVTTPNPHDVQQGYCPRCHWWTSDEQLGAVRRRDEPEKIAEANAFRMWRERMASGCLYGAGMCRCPGPAHPYQGCLAPRSSV